MRPNPASNLSPTAVCSVPRSFPPAIVPLWERWPVLFGVRAVAARSGAGRALLMAALVLGTGVLTPAAAVAQTEPGARSATRQEAAEAGEGMAESDGAMADPGGFRGIGLCVFRLDDYQLPPATETSVNKVVTDALRKHESVFGFKAAADFRVRIRIFGRFEEFERFTRTNRHAQQIVQHTQSLTNLGGYYSHRIRQVVTWRQRHPTQLANTLLHEASHAILHGHYRRVPMWLSEGSATYFAYPRHLQDDRDVGSLQYRWAKLLVMLRGRQLPAVRELLSLSNEDWLKLDPAVSYSTAWSLFQLMMSTPARQQALQRHLRDLQAGRRGEVLGEGATAMEKHYPGGLAQLEKDWHGWITQGAARVLGRDMEELLKQVR